MVMLIDALSFTYYLKVAKWYFLSHFIGQINQLTIVVLDSNRLIRLKELTKQHTLRVPSDAQKGFLT
uniref:Mobile element protein n=1 Tax=Heterorhabditis bacteriophora TaxID=37862 RepID=A0A1I7WVA5_HETBA